MFAVDSSLNESVIAICKFNNLDSNMRAIGKGLSGRKMLSIFEDISHYKRYLYGVHS